MKKIAISQSNYIPWRGYFRMIASVNEFILYDDMQYTRRDWRNRNQIKTANGLQWLTVPVKVKGKYFQRIRDTEIDGNDWALKHWGALTQNYRRSKLFNEIAEWLEPIYLEEKFTHISSLNRRLIERVCNYLEIETIISNSWDYQLVEGRSERLASLCHQAGASTYLSGPSAKEYLDLKIFKELSVNVEFIKYDECEVYPQLWGDFMHQVSIVDTLFNLGKNAIKFVKDKK